MSDEFLSDLNAMRAHLIAVLVNLGRSEGGATRQVADFEHQVRLAAIQETALTSQRKSQRQSFRGK